MAPSAALAPAASPDFYVSMIVSQHRRDLHRIGTLEAARRAQLLAENLRIVRDDLRKVERHERWSREPDLAPFLPSDSAHRTGSAPELRAGIAAMLPLLALLTRLASTGRARSRPLEAERVSSVEDRRAQLTRLEAERADARLLLLAAALVQLLIRAELGESLGRLHRAEPERWHPPELDVARHVLPDRAPPARRAVI